MIYKNSEAILLLKDLVSLFEKYDLVTFREAIDLLSRIQTTIDGNLALKPSTKNERFRDADKERKIAAIPPPEHLLEEIVKTDPSRAEVLSNIHQLFLKMSSIVTINEFRAFCQENGCTLKTRTKSASINEFFLFCSSLNISDLESILERASQITLRTGSSLEQWAGVILPDK